jgi:hypothetical protein
MNFENVIAHLDVIARMHASNARDPHRTAAEREQAQRLQEEYCAALGALGGEPTPTAAKPEAH